MCDFSMAILLTQTHTVDVSYITDLEIYVLEFEKFVVTGSIFNTSLLILFFISQIL